MGVSTTIKEVVEKLHKQKSIYIGDIAKYGLLEILHAYKRQYPETVVFELGVLPSSFSLHSQDAYMLVCVPQNKVYCSNDLLTIAIDNDGNIVLPKEVIDYANNVSNGCWFASLIVSKIPEIQKVLLDFYQWYCTQLYEGMDEIVYFNYALIDYSKQVLSLSENFGLKKLLTDLFINGKVCLYEYIQEPNQVDEFIKKFDKLKNFICDYVITLFLVVLCVNYPLNKNANKKDKNMKEVDK